MKRLTGRQREVLEGIANGEVSKVTAHRLSISVRTVEAYRAQLLERLGVRTVADAIRIATIAGLGRGMSGRDVRH
jgi:two-component system, LuxR family, response regulator FixJ